MEFLKNMCRSNQVSYFAFVFVTNVSLLCSSSSLPSPTLLTTKQQHPMTKFNHGASSPKAAL